MVRNAAPAHQQAEQQTCVVDFGDWYPHRRTQVMNDRFPAQLDGGSPHNVRRPASISDKETAARVGEEEDFGI